MWYKIILNLMEIMLPVLYLAYFKLYISTKEMLHVGEGDLLRILCYMLLYIDLFGVFCWTFYKIIVEIKITVCFQYLASLNQCSSVCYRLWV